MSVRKILAGTILASMLMLGALPAAHAGSVDYGFDSLDRLRSTDPDTGQTMYFTYDRVITICVIM